MRRRAFLILVAGALAGCGFNGPPPPAVPPPERLLFDGRLDLANPGIGFVLTHPSGLVCSGHFDGSRLPDTVTLALACNDQETGTLAVVKAEDIRGSVTLSSGRLGDVTFAPPAPPPPPVQTTAPAAPIVLPVAPAHASGPVYVHSYYRRGGNVRGYYRNGHYVQPHHRSGGVVHAHYRRRKH